MSTACLAPFRKNIMKILGIDTSNYTTSAAIYDSEKGRVEQEKMLLPVAKDERGIRQNDAVFHHTAQLPKILSQLEISDINCVSAAFAPRRAQGSYMPCFTCGESFARVISSALKIPLCLFSHQEGHIAAILHGAGRLDLLEHKFFAVHISGGTTEILAAEKGEDGISCEIIGKTLDISAGQVIDRIGVKMGLQFPAGAELDKIAGKSKAASARDCSVGTDCNFSGLENLAEKYLGKDSEEAAGFIFGSVAKTIISMLKNAAINAPVVLSGGVMSSKYIKNEISKEFETISADAAFSADNAVGIAVLASIFGEG